MPHRLGVSIREVTPPGSTEQMGHQLCSVESTCFTCPSLLYSSKCISFSTAAELHAHKKLIKLFEEKNCEVGVGWVLWVVSGVRRGAGRSYKFHAQISY